MRRSSAILVLAIGLIVGPALATPMVDSAVLNTYLWDDDSDSTLTTQNLYPTVVSIEDAALDGDGQGGEWANRHNFRMSANGGISEAVFYNDDEFEFHADVTISGPANSEGGLNLSPWWSKDFDGVFMLRPGDGEISCWGGRLPFYNFTAEHGVSYVKGTTVRLGMAYHPNSLTEADPATIEYFFTDPNGVPYTSGPLAFDMGNESEGPVYGLWGILNDARLGGYFQPQIDVGNPDNWGRIDFENFTYVPEPSAFGLLVLVGVLGLRRR